MRSSPWLWDPQQTLCGSYSCSCVSDQVLGFRRRPGSSSQSIQGVRGQSRMEGQATEQKPVQYRGWDMITSSGADQVMELLLNNEEG